ncbi:hypothetical protein BY996DRAFT_6534465 [Phakopsora pachyrhizi]|nr:hypothetical protein BY996DRAFT_6534465 [Phakopsora pachyrhizi]
MEARDLSLNTSLIDAKEFERIKGNIESDNWRKEAESLNGSGIGKRDNWMELYSGGWSSLENHFEEESSSRAEHQSITNETVLSADDQLIEGLVLLWSMTDSQRLGYHYLSNLKFGSTVDVKPIIQIDKQELGQRKEELAHIMVFVGRVIDGAGEVFETTHNGYVSWPGHDLRMRVMEEVQYLLCSSRRQS